MNKKIIVLFCFFLPLNFVFVRSGILNLPSGIDEAGNFILKLITYLPRTCLKIFKEEIFPFFEKVWGWLDSHFFSKFSLIFKKEVRKRKPIIEREFQKEKKSLIQEITSFLEKLKKMREGIKEKRRK